MTSCRCSICLPACTAYVRGIFLSSYAAPCDYATSTAGIFWLSYSVHHPHGVIQLHKDSSRMLNWLKRWQTSLVVRRRRDSPAVLKAFSSVTAHVNTKLGGPSKNGICHANFFTWAFLHCWWWQEPKAVYTAPLKSSTWLAQSAAPAAARSVDNLTNSNNDEKTTNIGTLPSAWPLDTALMYDTTTGHYHWGRTPKTTTTTDGRGGKLANMRAIQRRKRL